MKPNAAVLIFVSLTLSAAASAADLPDGAGKDILARACVGCHKAEEFPAYRHTKEEYEAIVARMSVRARNTTAEELPIIADYLARNFPKIEDPNKVNVNKASAKAIEAGLGLTAKEAEAIVDYRERHGEFRAWGDLPLIYGVDGKKIQAAKDKIGF